MYRMRVLRIKGPHQLTIRGMPHDGVVISSNRHGTQPHVPLYLEFPHDISQYRTLESLSDGNVGGE